MFTGIIETTGVLKNIEKQGSNYELTIECKLAPELKIDQSVAHNGVCLTVVSINGSTYKVVVIDESLNKTNFRELKVGNELNIERCMQMNGRLDGHIVQGHVDQTGTCIQVKELDGSWEFTFEYDSTIGNVTVEKGSVTINGTSLTVCNSTDTGFSVNIIPYTYEFTNFKELEPGKTVNLEFDIIGKYVSRLMR